MNRCRNFTIDCLRTLGILLVISAHCIFTEPFFSIRVFDVVLLVFVAGYSFCQSYQDKVFVFFSYIKKRFSKIVLRVWIFLLGYFLFGIITGYSYSLNTILSSFFMINGIGYVWIFRVQFISSILQGLIFPWFNKHRGPEKTILLILWFLAIPMAHIVGNSIFKVAVILDIYQYVVEYTLAYGFVGYFGMLWFTLSKHHKKIYSLIVSIICYMDLFYLGDLRLLQGQKYPPQSSFILYGLMVSTWLFLFFENDKVSRFIKNLKIRFIFEWISKNSLIIYLSHILVLSFVSISSNGLYKFLLVLALSIMITLAFNLFDRYLVRVKILSKE